MRKNVIAGNWKMHHTIKETKVFFEKYKSELSRSKDDLIIFPPYTSLETAYEIGKGTSIKLVLKICTHKKMVRIQVKFHLICY